MIPDEIPFDSVEVGERGRKTYSGIEELADSIFDNGLIQPIVLTQANGTFRLVAGGRRYEALRRLETKTLYHGVTSDPTRPGFVLKGEEGTVLQNLLIEIAENLDRDDLDWRDEMAMLNKAWKLAKADAITNGETILMRDFGAMLGCGYADLRAAVAIHDAVTRDPNRFKDVTGLRAAYSQLLKEAERDAIKVTALRSLQATPLHDPTVQVQTEPKPEEASTPSTISLTSAFRCASAKDFLSALPNDSIDHIITDPDYAVSIEALSSLSTTAAEGVAHENITASLNDLKTFIFDSFRVIKSQGFLVFFYDLDHHEKIQSWTSEAGFKTQRWPLIWEKVDYYSNGAPAYNFTKNMEYACVCRKPNATLSKAQASSIFRCGSGNVVRELGHPFAKPYALWNWIYSAVAIKGQVVCDPFAGRGSSCIAAARFGLRPIGCEVQESHYYALLLNLKTEYTKLLGPNVIFQ